MIKNILYTGLLGGDGTKYSIKNSSNFNEKKSARG